MVKKKYNNEKFNDNYNDSTPLKTNVKMYQQTQEQ